MSIVSVVAGRMGQSTTCRLSRHLLLLHLGLVLLDRRPAHGDELVTCLKNDRPVLGLELGVGSLDEEQVPVSATVQRIEGAQSELTITSYRCLGSPHFCSDRIRLRRSRSGESKSEVEGDQLVHPGTRGESDLPLSSSAR